MTGSLFSLLAPKNEPLISRYLQTHFPLSKYPLTCLNRPQGFCSFWMFVTHKYLYAPFEVTSLDNNLQSARQLGRAWLYPECYCSILGRKRVGSTFTLTLLMNCISECSIITMLTVEASRVKLTFKTLLSSKTLVRVVITLTRQTCSSHGVVRTFTLTSCHVTYLVWSITTTSWKQEELK